MTPLITTIVVAVVVYSILSYIIVGVVIAIAAPQTPNWEWNVVEISLCLVVWALSPLVLAGSLIYASYRRLDQGKGMESDADAAV